MKKELDIHNYKRRLENGERLILTSKTMSDKNKAIILSFRDHCNTEGLSMARTERYMHVLRKWSDFLKKDFETATKEDLMQAVRLVQEENYSPWTKATYKIILKCFYKWLKKTGDDFPEEVKWIKARIKKNEINLPGEGQLITEEEIKILVNCADSYRDKALISVLYESGTRIGELASLQIMNVKRDQYGMIIYVTGKTGSRPVRLISSAPNLSAWINMHPLRDKEESPLWVSLSTNCRGKMINYQGLRMIIQRIFKKAGINKRPNPHIFRHSRATFLANYLTEFQMNHYFGWVQGSGMPSTYVHMSNKKIDESMLMLNGIEVTQEKRDSILKPITCSTCKTINNNDSKFCSSCGCILEQKTAMELEEKQQIRKNSDEMLNVLFKDKEVLQVVMKKIQELGLQDKIVA